MSLQGHGEVLQGVWHTTAAQDNLHPMVQLFVDRRVKMECCVLHDDKMCTHPKGATYDAEGESEEDDISWILSVAEGLADDRLEAKQGRDQPRRTIPVLLGFVEQVLCDGLVRKRTCKRLNTNFKTAMHQNLPATQ